MKATQTSIVTTMAAIVAALVEKTHRALMTKRVRIVMRMMIAVLVLVEKINQQDQ